MKRISGSISRRQAIKGIAAAGATATLSGCMSVTQRGAEIIAARKSQIRHARLAFSEDRGRSKNKIPLPLDRRLLLAHERRGGRNNRSPRQHQSAFAVSRSISIAWVITAARAGGKWRSSGPFAATFNPTRRSARSACANANGNRRHAQDSARLVSGVYLGKLTAERERLAELRHFHRPR